ncbi:MAG: hypothetical protein F7B20_01695 [Aeropyrum sp.]|nr:hypothetical protein [Aeropyrum sp.]MCE4616236.1 hypothetical protein [Aeropyrum sp.]
MVGLFSRLLRRGGEKPHPMLGWEGFLGGLLKVVAAYYLVFVIGLFSGLKTVLEGAEARVASLEAAGQVSAQDVIAVLEFLAVGVETRFREEALGILAGLVLWILGGYLFSREWDRLTQYWPPLIVRAFRAFVWLSRVVALLAGIATGFILSRLSGDVAAFLASLRIYSLIAILYIMPLLPPAVYSLIALLFPPPSSRAGVLLLVAGAVLYVYSMYSVIMAFRPLSALSGPIEEVLTSGLGGQAGIDLLYGVLRATEILVERLRNTIISLALATALYTLGFALIGFRKSK